MPTRISYPKPDHVSSLDAAGIVGGTNGAKADVGPDNLGIGMVRNDVVGIAACLGAGTTESSGDALLLWWV